VQLTPLCDTVTLCPPTSTVAARALAPALAATLTVSVPDPVPLAGVTLAHPALVAAVHVQPLRVVTCRVPDPLPLPSDSVIGATV
jgi:hypothetical protein